MTENNKLTPPPAIPPSGEWRWSRKIIGPISATIKWRSRKTLWGRFGGGWQWKVGVSIGGGTILFDMLIFSVRLDFKR